MIYAGVFVGRRSLGNKVDFNRKMIENHRKRKMEVYPLVKNTKKLLKNTMLKGKLTISMAMFNDYVILPRGTVVGL